MATFDYIFVSALFGLSGTFILLLSNIFAYRYNVVKKQKYYLVSQLIGFLFLFNSFLYLLWPKISSQIGSIPPITNFSYWPYYFFMGAGIIISLFLVKEKDFGRGQEVFISFENKFELGVFFSPAVFALLVMLLNADFLLFLSIIAWLKFTEMLWKRGERVF